MAADRAFLLTLIRLLDDPSETVARGAMTELLKHEQELGDLPAEFQEADDPQLRKRIHQLQSILTLRERRRDFLRLLEEDPPDLFDGLVALHLQWFDNDSQPAVEELFDAFASEAMLRHPKTLQDLAAFMMDSGFAVPPETELNDPENYCIGTVLEDRLGSELLLCLLLILLGFEAQIELGLARVMGRFVVLDRKGNAVSPAESWTATRGIYMKECEFWNDPAQVLRYVSLMLFLYAVSSDSFRYVYTLAQTVGGFADGEGPDFLPYPYGGSETR